MSAEQPATSPLRPLLGQLERTLIDEFVRTRGFDPHELGHLPQQEREALLKDASVYASGRLAEVESRSQFLDEIHQNSEGLRKAPAE